jgi:hypothetical protein
VDVRPDDPTAQEMRDYRIAALEREFFGRVTGAAPRARASR